METTRHALANAAAARNNLLAARRDEATNALRAIDAESDRATQSLQQALEYGDLAKSAKLQHEIAALETRRGRVQDVAEQLHRTPPEMLDPVDAFAAGRCMRADRNRPIGTAYCL
jgi:citrate synthase